MHFGDAMSIEQQMESAVARYAKIAAPDLHTSSMRLREWTDQDIPTLVEAYSDPMIAQFSALTLPFTSKEAKELVDSNSHCQLKLAVVNNHDKVMGLIGVHNIKSGKADVEGWTMPWARKSGVALKSLEMLSRWSLDNLPINRLDAFVQPENIASQKVVEKAGFQRRNLIQSAIDFQGELRDVIWFSLS